MVAVGRSPVGTRLPSIRQLAGDLGPPPAPSPRYRERVDRRRVTHGRPTAPASLRPRHRGARRHLDEAATTYAIAAARAVRPSTPGHRCISPGVRPIRRHTITRSRRIAMSTDAVAADPSAPVAPEAPVTWRSRSVHSACSWPPASSSSARSPCSTWTGALAPGSARHSLHIDQVRTRLTVNVRLRNAAATPVRLSDISTPAGSPPLCRPSLERRARHRRRTASFASRAPTSTGRTSSWRREAS